MVATDALATVHTLQSRGYFLYWGRNYSADSETHKTTNESGTSGMIQGRARVNRQMIQQEV